VDQSVAIGLTIIACLCLDYSAANVSSGEAVCWSATED